MLTLEAGTFVRIAREMGVWKAYNQPASNLVVSQHAKEGNEL